MEFSPQCMSSEEKTRASHLRLLHSLRQAPVCPPAVLRSPHAMGCTNSGRSRSRFSSAVPRNVPSPPFQATCTHLRPANPLLAFSSAVTSPLYLLQRLPLVPSPASAWAPALCPLHWVCPVYSCHHFPLLHVVYLLSNEYRRPERCFVYLPMPSEIGLTYPHSCEAPSKHPCKYVGSLDGHQGLRLYEEAREIGGVGCGMHVRITKPCRFPKGMGNKGFSERRRLELMLRPWGSELSKPAIPANFSRHPFPFLTSPALL